MGGTGAVAEEESAFLLGNFPASVDEELESPEVIKRTGTIWTALAHIITGVIGAGVLSLAWSVAQLGWIAGPLCMLAFAAVTFVSSFLLCDCYRFPDSEYGQTRIRSYMEAVRLYLGEKNQRWCGVVAQESLYGAGIAYTITASSSVREYRPPTTSFFPMARRTIYQSVHT